MEVSVVGSSQVNLGRINDVGFYDIRRNLNANIWNAKSNYSNGCNLVQSRRFLWPSRFAVLSLRASASVQNQPLVCNKASNSSRNRTASFNFAPLTTSFSMDAPLSPKVKACSTIGAPNNELETSSAGTVGANDLLIVGPGILGRIIAEEWRKSAAFNTEYPGSQIYGQTLTSNHHEELIKLEITPSLKGTQATHKFPYIIFSAPSYGNADYPGEVREATLSWNGEGCFLFTSSSAPYDCSDNGYCDEDTPDVPIGKSPRTDNLLKSEKVVLEAGGCVVRLAGLYKVDRGAHTYWLEKGISEVRPDHILNLIHYEDAASLSITILKKNLRGKTFLGCDNHPVSRQEIMELVNRSGKYSKKFEAFTGTSDPLGKKLNNSKTRAELGWEPKYPSFAQFLETLSVASAS